MPNHMDNQTSEVKAYVNQDVVESLRARDQLEDLIFQQLDKVQALSEAQRLVDRSETPMSSKSRCYYSTLLDDQLQELRGLLERCFS